MLFKSQWQRDRFVLTPNLQIGSLRGEAIASLNWKLEPFDWLRAGFQTKFPSWSLGTSLKMLIEEVSFFALQTLIR